MKGLHRALSILERRLEVWRATYFRQRYRTHIDFDPTVRFGKHCDVKLWMFSPTSRLTIGRNTRFRRHCILTLDAHGEIVIGRNTFFNNACTINCLGQITIGDDTLFGEGVRLYDHNHVFYKSDVIVEDQGLNIGEIKIGNNCWIGANVVVLNNVVIGDNCVVGAGCVISTPIPSGSIVRLKQTLSVEAINFRNIDSQHR